MFNLLIMMVCRLVIIKLGVFLLVWGIVLCKNEEKIIPWCIDYWRRVADHVVVFDNFSTDSSIELLSQHDWIEIRYFETEGQNDPYQKQLKEQAYLEYKNKYDIIIISDMDEVFYFNDFKAVSEAFIDGGYNVLATPIFSLCEAKEPPYSEGKLLHQECSMFYKQRMNHMQGFEDISKLSIFNTKTTDKVQMSVGQHYVQTSPSMKIMLSNDGFCLHVDKGLGEDYFVSKRKKMGDNLSDVNLKGGLCVEYLKSEEESRKEYKEKQAKSFNLNDFI